MNGSASPNFMAFCLCLYRRHRYRPAVGPVALVVLPDDWAFRVVLVAVVAVVLRVVVVAHAAAVVQRAVAVVQRVAAVAHAAAVEQRAVVVVQRVTVVVHAAHPLDLVARARAERLAALVAQLAAVAARGVLLLLPELAE